MVIASAGHTASHSLQAMQRSSPFGIAAQRVQAAEARALRRLLLRELHRDLAREQVAPGQRHALHQLEQQEGAGRNRGCVSIMPALTSTISTTASASTPPITTIQTIVIGMNTFQPSRMIWS